ncbi:MAG: arylsulfatase [Acidobacteria bacterium]|nr:arylsulfatase [Acidobacteriota bacterium]
MRIRQTGIALSLALWLGSGVGWQPSHAELPFKEQVGSSAKNLLPDWPKPLTAPKGAPNVVVILLDDSGFAETSTFGGVVQTPTLDELAAEGLRYNRFHVTALCSPTRAALLTGRNHHRVGFGVVTEGAAGFPGYNGIWKKSTVSVAEVLRRNGYSTAAFGKWHNTPYWEISPVGPFDRWPTGLGFEYFYGFMIGETSQWEPPLYRNTTAVETEATPERGYHVTADIVNDAISWVQTHESLAPETPYFLYFATGGTHKPHHVPAEWINKYRGKFDDGWDKLREEIFARQKKLGVVPADAKLTPRPKELPAWDSLTSDEKKLLAHQMEVYAGFSAQTHHEIGRLLKAVKQGPQAGNTLIFYIASDNGASGMDGLQGNADTHAPPETVEAQLHDMDELGGPKHLNAYASAWAWMNNTPFQWMKMIASHFGSTRSPLIVSWPERINARGGLRTQFTHVNDIAATIYDAAGIRFPTVVDGTEQQPLDGVSFAYTFDNAGASSRHRVQYFENVGNRAIYMDGWIASARHTLPFPPRRPKENDDFEADHWELYDLEKDFSQAHDLAVQYPDKLKELQGAFETEARKNDVYPILTSILRSSEPPPFMTRDRNEFVYYPDTPRVPSSPWLFSSMLPDFSQSHRIVASVTIPDRGAEGVVVSNGSRFGGFVMYVKKNRLVYENNYMGRSRDVIRSDAGLPRGKVELAYEFVLNGPPPRPNEWQGEGSGVGRLYINGEIVGEAKLLHIARPYYGTATFNIGQARVSPVSAAYKMPFKFTGFIEKVTVLLK